MTIGDDPSSDIILLPSLSSTSSSLVHDLLSTIILIFFLLNAIRPVVPPYSSRLHQSPKIRNKSRGWLYYHPRINHHHRSNLSDSSLHHYFSRRWSYYCVICTLMIFHLNPITFTSPVYDDPPHQQQQSITMICTSSKATHKLALSPFYQQTSMRPRQ